MTVLRQDASKERGNFASKPYVVTPELVYADDTMLYEDDEGLMFDEKKERLCWDATTPIPSEEYGVRRWPSITLHSPETLEKVAQHPELESYEWPPHLSFGGPQ